MKVVLFEQSQHRGRFLKIDTQRSKVYIRASAIDMLDPYSDGTDRTTITLSSGEQISVEEAIGDIVALLKK